MFLHIFRFFCIRSFPGRQKNLFFSPSSSFCFCADCWRCSCAMMQHAQRFFSGRRRIIWLYISRDPFRLKSGLNFFVHAQSWLICCSAEQQSFFQRLFKKLAGVSHSIAQEGDAGTSFVPHASRPCVLLPCGSSRHTLLVQVPCACDWDRLGVCVCFFLIEPFHSSLFPGSRTTRTEFLRLWFRSDLPLAPCTTTSRTSVPLIFSIT